MTTPFEEASSRGVHANVMRLLGSRRDWQGKQVVDLACGDGRTTYLLRQLGARVAPFDLFPENGKLEDRPGFADVQETLPIPDGFADLVILQEVIEHLPDQLFALREISRILKPGGELFLTTPSRSSLASRLSYLFFESENLRGTPWGATNGVWGEEEGRKYYGHLWLVGIQQLRALGGVAGFEGLEVQKTEVSKASVVLLPLFYPFILLVSARALYRDLRKASRGSAYHAEKIEQFKLNVHPRNLINKYLIAILRKRAD